MTAPIHVEIVSPNGSVFAGDARGIRAPGVLGSFEVLHNHAPMIAAIEIGSLHVITPDGGRITFATSGGFVEVVDNVVTVLAETAEPESEIDVNRAEEAEERARERLRAASPEQRAAAEKALQRARNRLRVAMSSVGS